MDNPTPSSSSGGGGAAAAANASSDEHRKTSPATAADFFDEEHTFDDILLPVDLFDFTHGLDAGDGCYVDDQAAIGQKPLSPAPEPAAEQQPSPAPEHGDDERLVMYYQGQEYVFDPVQPQKIENIFHHLNGQEMIPQSIRPQPTNLVRPITVPEDFDRMKRSKGKFAPRVQTSENSLAHRKGITFCTNCGESSDATPMMRHAPNGTKSFCNACGLMWANSVDLMRKRLQWLKYEMKKKEWIEAHEQEKTMKKKMEETAKIWEDSKRPIDITVHLTWKRKKEQLVYRDRKYALCSHTEQQRAQERENVPYFKYKKDKQTTGVNMKKRQDVTDKELQLAWTLLYLNQVSSTISLLLELMENKNNKLLHKLKYFGAEKINEAYHWVQDNRYKFRTEVYGPVLLEVNIQDKAHASYLEGHVPNYIWKEERPLYLFDAKFTEKVPEMGRDYEVPAYFREDLFGVLGEERPDHRWVIIGPAGSGSSFHVDPNSTSAWNAVIKGAKKWVMFPPEVVPPGVHPSADGAEVTSPVSIMEWFMNFYGACKTWEKRPVECICRAGEVVFVPNGWWHLVINLEESIAITQNYTQDFVVRN
ncbi:hypothetical protein OsI_36560 [Oryza sativa Indica Group]|uniref:JmjC domain-containing protein n=1 Tax=Oryza sativa subsp. indica TaxID=39946 RepID=B8BL63_ORYSI|nr:hypothetical protein OsI_36560 [Oryza sativa Indica Group]